MSNMLTTPTFIFGLGGIGQIVTALIADRFHKSRWNFVPPTVRIRALDSAPVLGGDIPISRDRHFTQTKEFSADEVIQNLDLHPEIKKWWDYRLTPGYISLGAGAKRPVGRLCFFVDFEKLHQVLNDDFKVPLADELQRRLIDAGLEKVKKHPQVYLIGSLAGGTCSGMVIDMAFLVRQMLEKLGYESGGINITAILALQSVIEVAAKDEMTNAAKGRRLNSYGAIQEIDYLMGGWTQEMKVDYPDWGD